MLWGCWGLSAAHASPRPALGERTLCSFNLEAAQSSLQTQSLCAAPSGCREAANGRFVKDVVRGSVRFLLCGGKAALIRGSQCQWDIDVCG